MTPEKIVSVIEQYEDRLRRNAVPKTRMDPRYSLAELSVAELLAHAHFLCDGAKEYARDPNRYGKANRHLASIQMCLSFANWYALEELMEHNRP